MIKRKSQASIEYLTTYAWAFIIIIIIVGAISYLGLLDFGKFLPQKCVFSNQFPCNDFNLKSNGEVRVKLVNNIGLDVEIVTIIMDNNEKPPLSCNVDATVTIATVNTVIPLEGVALWGENEEADILFTGCSGGGYQPGERIEGIVDLNYRRVGSTQQHITLGKLSAKVLN
tara:strand:+ start:512 stop:1024 length:513 start_codon:yes stop_codon:yes gene_type:complete